MRRALFFIVLSVFLLSFTACQGKEESVPSDSLNPTTSSETFQSRGKAPSQEEKSIPSEKEETLFSFDYEEANKAYARFLEATNSMDGNQAWYELFNIYDVYSDKNAKTYEELGGGTTEEWNAKTSYEKFLWYETYGRITEYMVGGTYERYFGSEDNFFKNGISFGIRNLERYGNGSEVEAYKELMLWQYEHVLATGNTYDFTTGKTYLEIMEKGQ